MNKSGDWNDLEPRLISGVLLLFVSGVCIFLGGYFFTLFIIALVGIMHWELGKMLSPLSARALCGLALYFQWWLRFPNRLSKPTLVIIDFVY